MTPLPLEPAVAAGASGVTILWLLRWIWEERRAERAIARISPNRSWHCQICAAFYTTPAGERLTICPRCGSYNSEEGAPL
jgi:hypothetical protein